MYRRLYKLASPLIVLVTTGGCVQMTRHSNMVVFGTNTSVGVRVGTSATSVPEVQLGFSRQEAVVMPLVANTASHGTGSGDVLDPCDLTRSITVAGGGRFAVHPCSLVAVNGSAMDSYSVLASFGARFSGTGSAQQGEASAGLAQYFATGMAAQLLALNGGAAVVAVSQAATAASTNPLQSSAVRSLFNNPAAYQRGVELVAPYEAFEARLLALVDALGTDADVATKIANFETNAGIPAAASLRTTCAAKAACLAAIRGDSYGQAYVNFSTAMNAALDRW